MAIFRLQITPITRGGGQSSVGAAAYRAGERLTDDRTNEVYNHSRRKDVTHSEIMLPGHLAGENMDWARNRASLWNSVENAETRKNARVATEVQVTLPFELPPQKRVEMARAFSQEMADRYNIAVDLAVHDPRPSGDPRNFHAHLLLTTREVSPQGLGAKAGLNMQSKDRLRLGLPNTSEEFTAIRERWATLTNETLREANIGARVDHRSLAEQGIDREPGPHIPFAAFKMERAGKYSEVAQSIREEYEARVQARKERVADQASGATAERPSVAAGAERTQPAPGPTTVASKNLEDIRREARENWLRMRAAQGGLAHSSPPTITPTAALTAGPTTTPTTAPTATPTTTPKNLHNGAQLRNTPARGLDDDHQP